MRPNKTSRFRFNFAVISAVVVFGIGGYALSRTVSSESVRERGPFGVSAASPVKGRLKPLTKQTDVRPTLSPLVSTGKLVFGRGYYFQQGIVTLSDIGGANTESQIADFNEHRPVFSRDGFTILFTSQRDSERSSPFKSLYKMDVDGFGQTRLTDATDQDLWYQFSPDGTKIVYTFNGDLWLMNADGSGKTMLADLEFEISDPSFSPDGNTIIFGHGGRIWKVNPNGTGQTDLGNPNGSDRARYSPDGAKIVFSAFDEIYTVDPDGTNENKIIDDDTVGYSLDLPDFSPDGTKLLMACRSSVINICTSDANGGNFSPLAGVPTERQYPAWSPDSSTIAFISRDPAINRYSIFIAAVGGGEPQSVYFYDSASPLSELAWQPVCDFTPPPTPTPTATPTPANGLISEWNANDATADDSVGTNNGQFLDGAALTAFGKVGYGFDLAGDGGFIEIPDSESLDVQAADYTLSTWFKPYGSAEHYIAGKGACGDNFSNFYIGVNELNVPFIDISWESGGSRVSNGGVVLTNGVWHHLLLRKEGTIYTLFVDGDIAFTHTETNPLNVGTQPFTIGKGDGCTPPVLTTNGAIDEVRLYGRALSDIEVGDVFTGAARPSAAGNAVCVPTPDPFVRLRVHNVPVAGGRNARVLVQLREAAPSGGYSITLATTDVTVAAPPASVVVPEGNYGVYVDVPTTAGSGHRSADITATRGTDTAIATVSVAPSAPDIAASNLTAPASVSILQNFTASWRVTNNGHASTNDYRQDTLFISPDDTLFNSADDVVVGRKYENGAAIAAGAFRDVTFDQVNIPASAIPIDGTYYLFVLVGDAGTVNEQGGNFGDNFVGIPITVDRNLPDLVAQNIAAPIEVEPSTIFTVTWDVKNQGSSATLSGSSHYLYYSFDQTAGNADDVLITQRFAGVMAVNEVQSYTQQYFFNTLPVRPSSDGMFYVKVDVGGQVYEDAPGGPAETNNTTTFASRFEYRVPDLQVVSVAPPAEVESDTVFSVNWTTQNAGNKAAPSMNESVYFSTDNIVSSNDTLLGTFNLAQSLDAGQSVSRSQNVSIPTNAITSTGDYYVYVLTDSSGSVDEGANETNNTRFSPLRVRRLLRPDLQIANITAPASAFFDQEIQVQWTVSNTGNGPTNAANWQDELYLGLNQTMNGATRLATLSNVSYLNAGESYLAAATVRIPRGSSGSYYLLVKTDKDGLVNEENENNNLTTRPITINIPPLPDLRTSNVQAPETGVGGQPFEVSWTVTNEGNGATPATEATWNDAVYISRDATLSGDDRFVGARPHTGTLAANAAYTVSNFAFTLPGDAFGDYYVFVIADAYGQMYEFNAEGNNSNYDATQPGSPMHVLGTPPDLTVLSPIMAPASELAGRQINIQFTVRNQGAFDAVGGWYDAVYISTDPTFDPQSDSLIGTAPHNGLSAGGQYPINMAVTLPNCLDGTFYLFAVTDYAGQIFEYDAGGSAEANNISQPRSIQISSFAPDLRVTNISVPQVVVNGAMPIAWTVKNLGTAAAEQTQWTDRVYLIFSGAVTNLGYFDRTGSLAIGAEYTQNRIVNIPLYLEGDMQIVVLTDIYNNVPECSYESNNEISGNTSVQQDLPDLRITGVNSPGTAALGQTFNVTWTGGNHSAAMASTASWADTVYLSADNTLSYGDIPIGGSVRSAQLGAGQTYDGAVDVTIPSVSPGNYYLFVNADNGGHIVEGVNENNNASAPIPITITAPQVDLQVTNLTANPLIYSGQFTDVSWTVTNTGSTPTISNTWTDYVVLSRDGVYDPTDRVIDFVNQDSALAAGAAYSVSRSIAIPAGLTGEYKIFVVTDRNNYVVESAENNNISSPVSVGLQLPPPAELNITNITPPLAMPLGEDAVFEWTVQNSSANAVNGIWQDSVYLSTDSTWDSGDVLIGTKIRSGTVGAFATYTETLNTAVPPVELGSYHVIVRTDSRNSVRESNETNNVAASPGVSAVSVSNLTLGSALNTSLVTGQERYYSILNTPADETMLVTLDGEDGSRNELYSRFGTMVSRANYEYQGTNQGGADQENIVPNTSAGTYYTMARGDHVPGSFAGQLKKADAAKTKADAAAQAVIIKASLLPFGIRTVSPGRAGNKGYTFLNIDGAKFQDGATVKMVGPGGIQILPLRTIFGGSTNVKALFDLNNAVVGDYQVTLINPNAQASTWSTNFHVQSGGGSVVRSEVNGAGEVRAGRYYRYTVTTRNDGMNDAVGIPILIVLSSQINYRLSASNQIQAQTPGFDPSTAPTHYDVDGKRVIVLFAPVVRSNESVNIGIDLEFAGQTTITATSLPSIYVPNAAFVPPPGFSRSQATSGNDLLLCFTNLIFKSLLTALSEILPVECAASVANAMLGLTETAFSNQRGGFDAYSTAASLLQSAVNVAGDCAKNLVKYVPWIKLLSLLYDIYQIANLALECVQKTFEVVFHVNLSRSIDPNEKLGPAGFGPEHWVAKNKPLLYRINFENLPTASAPAQQIRVVDRLPPTLDPRTLRLLEIGFKQYRVEVPNNRAFYQTRLQLGDDLNNLKANISAGLDITTGRVTWTLTAIDPQTNERPLSPLLGILPPNNADSDGEGYVIFSVAPAAGQPTRTDIANAATIYFDENEPIATNATTNLLDADLPVSQIAALPTTTSDPAIVLNWSGSDDANGSGLSSFDVFVSENGGAYLPFMTGTTGTSGVFNGKYGRSYRFYSVASDNAGNIEIPPVLPDTEITVLGGAFEGDLSPRPGGNNDGSVTPDDVDQARRFAAKLDTDLQLNEFQRADTSPRGDGGDGSLSVADVVQTRRFASGFDAVAESAGPNIAGAVTAKTIPGRTVGLLGREIHPVRTQLNGNKVTIAIKIEAQGDEVGAGFTLNFDPAVLSNPSNITLGADAVGMTAAVNTAEAAAGRIGFVMDKAVGQPLAAGPRVLITLDFDVAAVHPNSTTLSFGNSPVKNEVVSGAAAALTTTFTSGTISLLAPTAAGVTVSGRVTDPVGRPIAKTLITLAGDSGERQAISNAFGFYRFDDVEAGRTYVVSASDKRYRFSRPSFILFVGDAVDDADFAAQQ